MVALHGINPPESVFREQLARITDLVWEQAGRVLRTGGDVVLDSGFWTRKSRDEARQRAKDLGVAWQLYSLQCPVEEARRRVLARTEELPPGTLEITGPTFDCLLRQVEPLGEDEDHILVEASAPLDNL